MNYCHHFCHFCPFQTAFVINFTNCIMLFWLNYESVWLETLCYYGNRHLKHWSYDFQAVYDTNRISAHDELMKSCISLALQSVNYDESRTLFYLPTCLSYSSTCLLVLFFIAYFITIIVKEILTTRMNHDGIHEWSIEIGDNWNILEINV